MPTVTVLLRPKFAVALALMLLSALAWLVLAGGAEALAVALMGHGLPAAHDHAHTHGVMTQSWGSAQWFGAWFIWLTMTVAMMLPTAAPAVLSLGEADANADAGSTARATLRQAGAFVAGYLLAWGGFGLVATTLQWWLATSAWQLRVEPGVATALAGCVLVLAGLYQFSSLKRRCLAHCHGPLGHLHGSWRADSPGAHRLGLRHGFHCLGCCWALMVLMLLGGAMSIGWMAALAGLMLVEKLLPGGLYIARVAGMGLVGWGSVLLATI